MSPELAHRRTLVTVSDAEAAILKTADVLAEKYPGFLAADLFKREMLGLLGISPCVSRKTDGAVDKNDGVLQPFAELTLRLTRQDLMQKFADIAASTAKAPEDADLERRMQRQKPSMQ